jgi:hypothetical protein
MLIVAQFPIADARGFVADRAGRLRVPDWPPAVSINPQFVRCFGPAVRRRRGADAAWLDEHTFCKANRALRFPGLHAGRLAGQLAPACAFRRLLSDGEAVTRVELGIGCPKGWALKNNPSFSDAAATEIIRHVLALQSEVPTPSGKLVRRELVRQGAPLAKIFASATTGRGGDVRRATALVAAGSPLLIIEFDRFALRGKPTSFKTVEAQHVLGADLSFGRITVGTTEVGVWLIGPVQRDHRSLRLCLLRLHAEQEALDLVLRYLRRDEIVFRPRTEEGKRLESYFNRATKVILQRRFARIEQSAILEAARAVTEIARKDVHTELLERLEGARRQIRLKIEEYDRWRRPPVQGQGIEGSSAGGDIIQVILNPLTSPPDTTGEPQSPEHGRSFTMPNQKPESGRQSVQKMGDVSAGGNITQRSDVARDRQEISEADAQGDILQRKNTRMAQMSFGWGRATGVGIIGLIIAFVAWLAYEYLTNR